MTILLCGIILVLIIERIRHAQLYRNNLKVGSKDKGKYLNKNICTLILNTNFAAKLSIM